MISSRLSEGCISKLSWGFITHPNHACCQIISDSTHNNCWYCILLRIRINQNPVLYCGGQSLNILILFSGENKHLKTFWYLPQRKHMVTFRLLELLNDKGKLAGGCEFRENWGENDNINKLFSAENMCGLYFLWTPDTHTLSCHLAPALKNAE